MKQTNKKQIDKYREQIGHYQKAGALRVDKIEEDQKEKTSSYKVNKSQECNVQHTEYSQ